ncbi:MAG: arginyltransferase [Rhodobacter sp.]|nr:arginyltransferase [Gammaproteobacteria bacterium]MDJ0828178.1 arginyltransferase [Rhodobacter sp.]
MNDQAKLNFFASTPEPCSYLENRKSVSAFANPHMDMDMNTYNELIRHGFRRSGGYIYRPHCPQCQECISVRIPVKAHRYSRNEKRVIRRNSDLRISIMPSRYRDEHFDLYRRYINSRHDDGSMANPNKSDYHRFLICDWTDTLFYEYRLNRILIAVAVCDLTDTGLSAVYTFFDPDHADRSLGHFAILNQIHETRLRDLDYLYLGYWIRNCSKMSYKRRYRPLEAYLRDQWVILND